MSHPSAPLRLLLVQPDIVWEDRDSNRQLYSRMIEGKAKEGSLIIFPEMCEVGFSMNAAACADVDGSGRTFFSEMARRTRSHIIAGLVTSDSSPPANTAVVFDPSGAVIARYDKRRPFTPADEHKNYSAGHKAVVVEICGVKVGLSICYDLRFPELYRDQIDLGAELLVVIANWPSPRVGQKIVLLRARAIENQAFVVLVNRSGTDPTLTYPGRSMVIDPKGEILFDAGESQCVLDAEIDVSIAREWREAFPALRDR